MSGTGLAKAEEAVSAPAVHFSTLFSFETPDVGNLGGRYLYNPTGQVPTFQSRSGVAANGSDWGFHAAPDGQQVAFVQSSQGVGAIISLPLNGIVPGRSYRVHAWLARRPGYGVIPVTIKQNGQALGTFTPASNDFSEIVTAAFQATGSTAEVRLEVSPTGGDGGSGVDMVYVEAAASSPPPPPPPANQPPVANPDNLSVRKCTIGGRDVVANDTDPEGNYPLSVTAVSGNFAYVANSTTVGFDAQTTAGTYIITYTVADSLGAASNGTLTVTVTGTNQCF